MRALCQSDAVLVVRVDPRRRATIAVVGLLLRCLEKALEDAEAQVVAVLAGWGEDTLSASALEGGTDEGEMAVAQIDTSGGGEGDEEEEDSGSDEGDDGSHDDGEGEGEAAEEAEEEEEEEEEDDDDDENWLYGCRAGVSAAQLREVMEVEDGVLFLSVDGTGWRAPADAFQGLRAAVSRQGCARCLQLLPADGSFYACCRLCAGAGPRSTQELWTLRPRPRTGGPLAGASKGSLPSALSLRTPP